MSALLLTTAIAAMLQDAASAESGANGDRLVRVELFADRAAVRPGETFTLGVQLAVDPGWHVYWENAGDSGLPTKFTIQAPPGFEVGAVRFPGPEREVAEGDIVTFVHTGKPLFLADVRAPASLGTAAGAGAKLRFEAQAKWLVCKEACFPGSGSAPLELPVSTGADKSAPANESLFAAARAQLPRPWKELAGAAVDWSGTEDQPTLTVSVPNAVGLELFPLASDTMSVTNTSANPADAKAAAKSSKPGASGSIGRLTAELSFERKEPADVPRVQGVLHVNTGKDGAFYTLDSTFTASRAESGKAK